MNTNKVLIGGLIGGVAFFFLGWLIYGMLLMGMMSENCNQSMSRPEAEFIWWAMIASNILWGLLMAVVFDWSNTSGWMEGAKKGAIIGGITSLGYDLSMYAMTTMFNNMSMIFVDFLAQVVILGTVGAIVGWYNGRD